MEPNQPEARQPQIELFDHLELEKRPSDTDAERTALAIMGLSSVSGVGFKTLQSLYDANLPQNYHTWDEPQIIRCLSEEVRNPNPQKIKDVAENRDEYVAIGRGKLESLRERGIVLVPANDGRFPQRLTERLEDPPRWLFMKGAYNALSSTSMVALIGTREPSDTGLWIANRCARALAQRNFIVLSGLARGIDSASHRGAVEAYGQSVAVLGHGFDNGLSEHQEYLADEMLDRDGLIVSEYLPDAHPSRRGFLRRNELVAALAGLVIPVECPSLESGTGATIRRAQGIKTPVIGIKPGKPVEDESLLATEDNLKAIDVPVLRVLSQQTFEFWKYLTQCFPDHDWRPQRDQVERFIRIQLRHVAREAHNLDLSSSDIDQFADTLKRVLDT